MQSAAAWRRLSRAERRVALEAILLLPFARVAVHTMRLDRLVPAGPRRPRCADVSGARVAQIVCRVAAHLGVFTCLDVAVAASWVMHRRGWIPVLCLGTGIGTDPFPAHAWVELDGRPVTPAGAHVEIWRSR
jgi:Transglutaminase-like superfamily